MQVTASGVIFWRTLRDSWKGVLGWGLMLASLGALVVAMFPSIEDVLGMFGSMLENPVLKTLVGDIDTFGTLEGFLGIKFFSMMPLILAVYVVLFALGIVAGEEERGTLDILLSTPAPRWQIIVEKFGAMIVAVFLILLMGFIGLFLGELTLRESTLNTGQVAAAVLNIVPITLFMGALTLLLSTVLRSRSTAGAISAGLIFVSYFMTTLGDMIDNAVSNIKYLSFYQYYDGANVLTTGVPWAGFVGLLVGAVILFGLSLYAFQRRDLLG
jgi:ABC-2 type transport system permease protein